MFNLYGINALILICLPLFFALVLAAPLSYKVKSYINISACFINLLFNIYLAQLKIPVSNFILIDNFSSVMLLLSGFIFFTTALFTYPYLETVLKHKPISEKHSRYFYAFYQLLIFAMNLSYSANNLALMWVAIEIATIVTILMISLYRNTSAIEASWKYFILSSVGISLALFGIILTYFGSSNFIANSLQAMSFTGITTIAKQINPLILNMAFVFIFIGYGAKSGLFPMHAWLPDAYSESPAPVSALLSGLLFNVTLYAILRFKSVFILNDGVWIIKPIMITIGMASFLFAAFMLYRKRDIKRMLAYSSIEHMGMMTFAFGIGGFVANFAGLVHLIAHSLIKSAMFFISGHILELKSTLDISDIKGLIKSHPRLGWGFVFGMLFLLGFPPSGIFISELLLIITTFKHNAFLAILLLFGIGIAVSALFIRINDIAMGDDEGQKDNDRKINGSYMPFVTHLTIAGLFGVLIPTLLYNWLINIATFLN